MAIPAGTRLGPYKIVSAIGAGGMGEVYRSRDLRLSRDVALKVLPEAFSRDAQRMARFEREAKLLASLNHTNIAAIYGLEDSGPIRALVMELVDGPTLADRIRSGPIPVDETLPIAKQIAEALEYAHDKNVIHRDLKPANIKVTPDGAVKVLDFGLAKAMSEEPSEPDVSNSPTLSMAATQQGMILGTASYMSPEQARGKPVDRRTDVWAFGCVLYEMLTGKRAFQGEDVTEVLAAVVRAEPEWKQLPESTPQSVRYLLMRCLEKNPKRRLQHIGEARIAIEDVISGHAPESAATTLAIQRERIKRFVVPVLAALTAILLVALVAVSWSRSRETMLAAQPEMRTEIATPSTIDPTSLALSPDGRQIVFVASGSGPSQLWLRRLDATEAAPLAGTVGSSYPFWSPDSHSIGFFAEGKLKRMDVAGGSPRTLAEAADRGGAWGLDGTILFEPNTNSPLFRIGALGGTPVAVTALNKDLSHRFPVFLPASRKFLFYAFGSSGTGNIYLGSLDSPETKLLTASDSAGAYLPSGWLLFIRGTALFAQQLNSVSGELTGDPVVVADPVAFDATFAGGFSASATGLIAYRPGSSGQTQLTWFDRLGKTLGTMGGLDANSLNGPRLSPDGRRAAVHRTVQSNTDIWIMDETRTTRFTFDAGLDRYPVWSPDGSRIVFDSNRKGQRNLYVKAANGGAEEEPLQEAPNGSGATDWSRDGRFILYQVPSPQAGVDIWVLPLQGDRKPFVFLATNFDERSGRFSPDGRWVAYESNASGRYEVYVRAFAGSPSGGAAGGQWQISTSGGMYPRWRSDGKELYFVSLDGRLMAVPITSSNASFEAGAPVVLFQARMPGNSNPTVGPQYDVSRDGRFLINTVIEEANTPITILQNWNPKVQK